MPALSSLDALNPDIGELEMAFPRGMAFQHSNAAVIRAVVALISDQLRDLGLRLRLRLEPPIEYGHTPSKPPKRLIVKDSDFSQRIDLSVNENYVLIGSEKVICTARDGAVARVSAALISSIKKVIHPPSDD